MILKKLAKKIKIIIFIKKSDKKNKIRPIQKIIFYLKK
jgi:hypothetical protein